jgi:hypothetical protein
MNKLEAPEIIGYTVFCDDIRFEMDGKLTLVGCYHGVMIIRGEFPATLPKFAVSVTFTQHKKVYEPKLRLKMSLPGDPEDEPSIVVEVEPPPEANLLASEHPNISAKANIIFAPLVITSPGFIKVQMERQGELHLVGKIAVKTAGAEAISSNE